MVTANHFNDLLLQTLKQINVRLDRLEVTLAEDRKTSKYSCLVPSHSFTPVAIESLGPVGRKTLSFLKELSQTVQQCTGEVRAHAYLLQRLSVAIQRGNAISVAGFVGCFWVWAHFMYSIVLLHQQHLLFGCLLLFVLLFYLLS